jgi:hypothetical protein
VAGRVKHDPPSPRPRLLVGLAGPQPDGLRHGRVQTAGTDRKIEMKLLLDLAARPGRRLVTGYPQGRHRDDLGAHHDHIVVDWRRVAAEERRPERRETGRVIAIEANLRQACQCHSAIVTSGRQQQRSE